MHGDRRSLAMTTLRELALDERLTARVLNAERRLHDRGDVLQEQVGLNEEEGLISAGARRRDAIYRRSGTRMPLAGKLTSAQRGTEVVGYLPLEEERRGARRPWNGDDRRRRTLTIRDLPELARQLDVHRVIIIPGEADSETMIDAVSRSKAAGVKVSI